MTHPLSHNVPKPLSRTEARSSDALGAMLDNLEELNVWVAEVDRERAEAMQSRGNLKVSIEAMLRAAPYEVARRHAERYARVNSGPETRPRELKGALGEVIRYLVENDFPTVRGADITYYLKRLGIAVNPRYAGKALQSLAADGMVTRTAHGIYAINRGHPELTALRIQMMEGRRHAPGSSAAPES